MSMPPRIHVAAVEVNQRLADVFQLRLSSALDAGRFEQIHVVIQRAGGSQIRNGHTVSSITDCAMKDGRSR